jgi:S1-C subfamily serine protease
LFEKIGTHEPGDTVTVTYLRDKKEYTAVVTLDERKSTGQPYPNNNDERGFSPRTPRGAFSFGDDFWGNTRDRFRNLSDNDAKLGLSVQDTESGNGAVVLDVKAGSPAEKAGFKTNDIITALAGVTISSTRDVTNAYRENKSKGTITAQVKRGGQQKTLQIQVPKKLHKADL